MLSKSKPLSVSRVNKPAVMPPFPVFQMQQPFPVKSFWIYQGASGVPFFITNYIATGSWFAYGDFRHYKEDYPHVIKAGSGSGDHFKTKQISCLKYKTTNVLGNFIITCQNEYCIFKQICYGA